MIPEFSAVLLAGGESTRMGRDKAGIAVHGRQMWERQLETLRATRSADLFISGRNDAPYSGADCEIVIDEVGDLGPLGGLVTALRRARFEYLLVLAIDLPAMTSDFLARRVESALQTRCGIVPADGAWFEAMAAVYTRACLPLAEEHLRSADRSMQSFIREALTRGLLLAWPISLEERALFQNVNTPTDLRAIS